MQTKTRNEISNEYKWDLTTIYKSDKDFYKDVDIAKELFNKLNSYKGILFDSIDNLKNYLKLDEKVELILNKILTYGIRKHDQDTSESKYQEMYQEVEKVYSLYGEKTSFFTPEVLDTDPKIIDKYLKDDYLKKYRRVFDNILRFKDHTLSKEQEELLSKFSLVFDSSSNTFLMLSNADLVFPKIKDEDGNDVELTEANVSKYWISKNRDVRRDAVLTLFDTYGKYANTFASTFNGHLNTNISIAKIRNYNSVREKELFKDNIPVSVYDNLIDTVKSRSDVINNYYGLIKEELGVSELHRYDTYATFGSLEEKEYSLDEAKSLIINTLNVLGEDYISKINRAFDEKWIDYFPNKGKRTGAYSSGGYGTNAFILTNFTGNYHDVSTLIHELGHSMHTTYSCEAQDIIYSDYPIFVAEVASTTNELLLAKYMLKNTKEKKVKLSILQQLLQLYASTMLRQTMFAEFERDAYDLKEHDKPLTHEILEEMYLKINKSYFGKNVILDEPLKYEWSRIPHFYYNFYVYKYATSLAASTYISERILEDDSFKEKYIKFLSSGSSMDPLDELKIVDVDLTKKEVINEAMNVFNSYIDEYRKIKNS